MPDGFFENTKQYQLEIIKVLRRYQPDIILCNAPSDRHPDHGRASKLTEEAAFLSGLKKIETEENGVQQEAWRPKYVLHYIQDRFLQPNFVYDITPVMEQKVESIKAYTTQFNVTGEGEQHTYISRPDFLDNIIYRAKMLGRMVGVEYAEGFLTEKMIGITTFDSLVQNVT
jgi:N-acetylglucosamine malate deacetylase 1